MEKTQYTLEDLAKAAEGRDAARYSEIAYELGYDSNEPLHEELMGIAEAEEIYDEGLEERMNDSRCLAMWGESKRKGIEIEHIYTQRDAKKEMLMRLFNDKFGEGKSQDLTKRQAAYIGTVFREVFRGARKRAEKYGLAK